MSLKQTWQQFSHRWPLQLIWYSSDLDTLDCQQRLSHLQTCLYIIFLPNGAEKLCLWRNLASCFNPKFTEQHNEISGSRGLCLVRNDFFTGLFWIFKCKCKGKRFFAKRIKNGEPIWVTSSVWACQPSCHKKGFWVWAQTLSIMDQNGSSRRGKTNI